MNEGNMTCILMNVCMYVFLILIRVSVYLEARVSVCMNV